LLASNSSRRTGADSLASVCPGQGREYATFRKPFFREPPVSVKRPPVKAPKASGGTIAMGAKPLLRIDNVEGDPLTLEKYLASKSWRRAAGPMRKSA
jgi:hypothetical protein